jgi:hypothetical protein
VVITNKLVHPSSKIFVTFTGPADGWYLTDKKEGSFKVVLKTPASDDVSFDYFLIQTQGQLASASASNDTVAPAITLNGSDPYYVPVGQAYTDPGAVATDDVDGSVAYTLEVNGQTGEYSAESRYL